MDNGPYGFERSGNKVRRLTRAEARVVIERAKEEYRRFENNGQGK